MLGAICGDIIGSFRENIRTKRKDFQLFWPWNFYTDDTVLTIAVAKAILDGKDYGTYIRRYARLYPFRGYGPKFMLWMVKPGAKAYNSLGNGSAMRVSPVGFAWQNEQKVLDEAALSAMCTHNHPEGIKGAQAVALAVYLAKAGSSKSNIRDRISQMFDYDLSGSVEQIRPSYKISLTCPGSVPQAIIAFLDSTNFEDAIRNAVSLGGDADTQAAIAGAIAEAYYQEIPPHILRPALQRIPSGFRAVIGAFYQTFGQMRVLNGLDEKDIPGPPSYGI